MKGLRILFITILLSACGRGREQHSNSAITLELAAANTQLLEQYPCISETGEVGVLVCHIPPGNFDALHDICLEYGSINTHLQGHGRGKGIPDVLGTCKDAF